MWAHVQNISGIDVYVSFDDNKIYEITATPPNGILLERIHERFQYIIDYLSNHTLQPVILEAIDDFDLSWATPFQLNVYKTLATIPSGTVISYSALAELAGRPGAARAVGSAMAKNRFLIAIPCHRVLAAGRKLGGFSGGLDKKIKLLNAEGVYDFRHTA